ncbi:MAG TPA: redoxin domain-containing protein [Chthonomonadaceae bacterium]|nr:redoxin domain-containing protein [Chthonomonadaceae bacterium]
MRPRHTTLMRILFALPAAVGMLCAWAQAARADAAGDALLQKCLDAETRTQTIQGDFTIQQNGGADKGTLLLKKPNVAHIVLTAMSDDSRILHSNGKILTSLDTTENFYHTQPADLSGGNVVSGVMSPEAQIFFNPDLLNRLISQGSGVKVGESMTIGGVVCKTLLVTGTGRNVMKFYVGPDYLLRGYTQIAYNNGAKQTMETRLTNVKANGGVPSAILSWSVPKGAKTMKEYASSHNRPNSGTSQEEGLIPVGKAAPAFELQQLGGGKINLANAVRSNKVTLVNFWASWCGPCREELPHLNDLLSEMRGKGFDILSVNITDNAATVGQVWKSGGFGMKALLKGDDVATQYRVQGIPTNYLIGSDGKILAEFVGFDETGIRQALAKAGIK